MLKKVASVYNEKNFYMKEMIQMIRIKRALLRALLFILVVFIMIFTVTGVVYASPLSEIYWMSASGAGVGPGGTAAIQTYLNNVGYNAKRYQDTSAYYVRRTMNNDVVFAIVTHGNPGRVYCNGGTTVSANIVLNDDDNYSLEARFGSGDFNGMKFAYYGACYTARTDSTYGNLLQYTTATLGAKSALGFYNAVSDAHATYFETKLFYKLCQGSTLANARSYALTATYDKYGSYGEVNSSRIYGNSSTTIYPIN
ncbi:hypothetical protein ES707_20177 [subsurface metagenome]